METYDDTDRLPERYRSTLDQMIKSHAYRELAAARLFGHGLGWVDEARWLKFIGWHINEEIGHFLLVDRLYQRFGGESIERWVKARLREKPVPLTESWLELAMAQFLYDRGGFWQLKEYEDCSYVPYREVVRTIVAEEKGHQELGERIVVEQIQTGRYEDVKQPLFERWLRLGLLSFGRPDTEGARYAREVGLKRRGSKELVQDFLDDIAPAVRSCGLRFPSAEALGVELPSGLELSWGQRDDRTL